MTTTGYLPIDNNRCENAIRPFVVGRKGWPFCDTPAGANVSTLIYSLLQTASANGLDLTPGCDASCVTCPRLRQWQKWRAVAVEFACTGFNQ